MKWQDKLKNAWFSHLVLILLAIVVVNNFGYRLKLDSIVLMYGLTLLLLLNSLSRKVLYFIVLVSLLYFPIAWYYSSPNMSLIASLVETQPHEAIGFFQEYSLIFYLLYFAIICFSLIVLRLLSNKKFSKNFVIGVSVVSAALLIKGVVKSDPIESIYERISALRVVPVAFFSDSIHSYLQYNQEIAHRKKLSNTPASWTITSSNNQNNELKILVIGESVRYDFMQVNGFPLPNTPFLSLQNGVFWQNFISPGTNTVSSLKHMLTLNKGTSAQLNNNFVTLAQQGGYKVSWISNQGRLGIADTYISSIAAYSDYEYFTRKGEYGDIVISDRKLLPKLEKRLDLIDVNEPQLIVLHLIDSHPPFCRGIEQVKFEYISEKLSCYVQKIANTDELIKDVVSLVKQRTPSYSLLYFADHGLVASDNKTSLRHGATQEAHKIPLFIIGSQYQNKRDIEAVKNGYDFVFGLSEWLGITTEQNSNGISLFDERVTVPQVIRGNKFVELNKLATDGLNVKGK